MAQNYVQEGNCLRMTAPSGGVVSANGYLVGGIFGVALVTAAEGETFELAVEGVWELPKTAANAPAQGAKAYWSGSEVTTTSTANTLIGVFTEAQVNGDATGKVRLGVVA